MGKNMTQKDTSAPVFTAARLTAAKTGEPLNAHRQEKETRRTQTKGCGSATERERQDAIYSSRGWARGHPTECSRQTEENYHATALICGI